MGPWNSSKPKQEKEIKHENLPPDVMRTSKLNIMQKDINFNLQKILNLAEIPNVSKAYVDANRPVIPPNLMRTDKVNKMTKTLDMNNFDVSNLPDPPTSQDSAVSKRYVDGRFYVPPSDAVTRSTNLSFLNNLNMNNNRITNLKLLPQNDTDAISKKYFDDNTLRAEDDIMFTTVENIMHEDLDMNSHKISGLNLSPVNAGDAISRDYLHKNFLLRSQIEVGGNMMHTHLDMKDHYIRNIKMMPQQDSWPSVKHSAVNREFLRDQFSDKLANVVDQSTPTIKDDFDFNNHKLLNLKEIPAVSKIYVDDHLPDMTNVMKTTQVNKMERDIDMNVKNLLNLKEIPAVSKAYVDANKYKLPPSVMQTTKINVMGADLDMNNNKLLNLTNIPENIKTYVDSETKFIYLDKAKTPAASFPPFDGTVVDTSGMIARLENDNLFYSTTLLPYVGYYSYYSDETETPSSPPNINNHWLKIHKASIGRQRSSSFSFKDIKSHYCGVTYNDATQWFVELKPYLIYKLTANVFATKDGSEYYFKHTMPQANTEIKTICNGRINHQPCKAIAFGTREILVGVHIALSSLTITHRTIEIEVMGAYKPGFF